MESAEGNPMWGHSQGRPPFFLFFLLLTAPLIHSRCKRVSAGAGTSLAAGGMRTVINLVYYRRSLEAPGHLGAPILAKPKENAMGTQKAFLQPRDIVPPCFQGLH